MDRRQHPSPVRRITDVDQAVAILRESENRYRSIFDSSPIAIWEEDFSSVKQRLDELRQSGVTDFDRYLDENKEELIHLAGLVHILDINQASVKLLGADSKEHITRDLPKFFTPESLPVFKREIVALAEGKTQFQSHIPIRKSDGEMCLLDLCLSVQAGKEQTLSRVLVSFVDITERKRTEQQLEISEIRYRTLFEETADYVLVLEPHGTTPPVIIDANEAAFQKFGYCRDELIGKPVTLLDSSAPQEVISERLKQLKSSGRVHFEVEHVCKNGSTFWADVAIRCVHISGKNLFYSVERDITTRKQADIALADSIKKLEEKELAKTRFFAAAGHDLRQPIAAANLFIDALKFTELSPQQERITQQLEKAMSTFNGLLETLLNISKLDSGVIKPTYSNISVTEIFNSLEHTFAPLANEKQLGFRLHFPMRRPLVVRSDLGLLNSVLMNLVCNAIKFTAQGALLTSARRRDHEILFQVWDTGVGISEENLGQVFDEFYQVDNPQRDRTSGLGLGLAIAKRAISLLGSSISCRSIAGRGSVFEFRLPLGETSDGMVQQCTTPDERDSSINISFVQGKRFVVIEDDQLVALALTQSLEGLGGEVIRFHSAEDALQHAHTKHADFYIVDHMLGGKINGIQCLNQLRDVLGKPVVGVLMSGDTSTQFIKIAANCDYPVLHKPINTYRLISSLKEQML